MAVPTPMIFRGADGGAERCGQGAELADVAVGVRIFRNGQLDGREGFLLDKSRSVPS